MEEKRKRRGGEFESDCIRRRVVREGSSGCYPQMGVTGVQGGKLNKLV